MGRGPHRWVAGPGDVPGIIPLAGLEAPGRERKVSGDGSGAFEPGGIVNTCLEGQRSDEAYPRRTHQSLTDFVSVSQLPGPVIQFAESAVQHQSRVQQRQQRLG